MRGAFSAGCICCGGGRCVRGGYFVDVSAQVRPTCPYQKTTRTDFFQIRLHRPLAQTALVSNAPNAGPSHVAIVIHVGSQVATYEFLGRGQIAFKNG
jgi:hypothetical protein